MMDYYGARVIGARHEALSMPCQDAWAVREGLDGIVAAAVADGVGSEPHSEEGSALAVRTAVRFCVENLIGGMGEEAVVPVMRAAFDRADTAILEHAVGAGNPRSQYNTTLCMALCVDGVVYCGQAGDSGMIVRHTDGRWEYVTRQQRGVNGGVYALWWGANTWEFKKAGSDITDIVLMTDGVLSLACPERKRECADGVNVPLAEEIRKSDSAESLREILRNLHDEHEDDKTAVVVHMAVAV